MTHSSSPYKILVISDYREVLSSRPEAEIFIGLARIGHTIHILSYPEATYYNDRFRTHGILVIEKHPTRKASLSFIRYLHHIIQDEQYDFVHAFNSLGLTNAVWGMIGLKSKLIAYRGYAGQTHWYDPMMYFKYFHPRVDHIFCVSHDTWKILSRNMPWGKKKLTIIHKGHDPQWFDNVVPRDRADLGFTDEDILICCVANVRPFKGIPYLIDAIHSLPGDLGIHILFIGSGFTDEPINSLIESGPYSHHIHRLGYREDNLSIVAACDGFVLSSTHGEALTKSVIEAMCLGIPPIITDIPGNKGLVIDGESGWVVPPGDPFSLKTAMLELVQNKQERKRRGQNAIEQIRKHFHTENTVAELVKLYARLKSED